MMIRNLLAIVMLSLSASSHAATISLVASLDGAQAGTGSLGTGSATMTLDDVTNEFAWVVEWSGLSGAPTVGHFHGPAGPGVNAGVQVPLDVSVSPTAGNTILTDQQETDLLAGLWYINIHTALNPGGEIRGQVTVVPLPGAAWLFGSAVLGLAGLRRRKA
jgi:hypothetical protein